MPSRRALQTVAALGAHALAGLPLPRLLEEGMAAIRESTGADLAVLFERSPGGDTLLMRGGGGWRPGTIGRVSLSTGPGSFGRYVMEHEAVFLNELSAAPEFGLPSVLRDHQARTMACVRLSGSGRVIGAFAVMNTSNRPFDDDDRHVLLATGNILASAILRQVTEEGLLQSQIRLQSVQKMEAIGRLAGGIAHDFNNLVQAIGGYNEMLLGRLDPDDPLRRNALEIKKAGDRAAALTRQLLAFSRQQVLQPTVIDVNEVVGHVESLLTRLIGEDVRLSTRLAAGLWHVRADATQLEQVLVNLAVNARDAMPRGGELSIETSNVELTRPEENEPFTVVAGPYVLLSVSDTGMGMNAETRARAFEPFFTTKSTGHGTGLGLSTVYGIVKQSGGYIWMDSELGGGTRVRIYLPRVEQMSLPLPASEAPVERTATAGGSETLLLVEDEDGVRELIHEWLSAHGYHVLVAPDGPEALAIVQARETPVDLLVADVVMPTMGGPALAKRLLARQPSLKVIFISGYADEAIGDRRMLDEGASFLQKPFTLDALLLKVRSVLDKAPHRSARDVSG